MRRGIAVAMVVGLLAATAGAGFAEADRGGSAPSVERRGGRTFQAAGYWSLVEPGPNGLEYETEGVVWLPVKRAKGVRCFGFDVERTASETTVTAYCDPGKRRGKLKASFEVDSWVWNGEFGTGFDSCIDRHEMRRNTVFTCTVASPDVEALPKDGRG